VRGNHESLDVVRSTSCNRRILLLGRRTGGGYLSRPVAVYVSRELQLDFDNYLLCAVAFVLGLLAISIVPALRATIGRFA